MAAFQKQKLTGSTNGRAIKVAATATPGTLVHTSVAGTTQGTYDEIWLYATNSSASAVVLTIEFGGTTSPDDLVKISIPPTGAGLVCVLPGLVLQNATVVRAFAGTTNVVMVSGFVNAITA
jgi:hypothetical protein